MKDKIVLQLTENQIVKLYHTGYLLKRKGGKAYWVSLGRFLSITDRNNKELRHVTLDENALEVLNIKEDERG